MPEMWDGRTLEIRAENAVWSSRSRVSMGNFRPNVALGRFMVPTVAARDVQHIQAKVRAKGEFDDFKMAMWEDRHQSKRPKRPGQLQGREDLRQCVTHFFSGYPSPEAVKEARQCLSAQAKRRTTPAGGISAETQKVLESVDTHATGASIDSLCVMGQNMVSVTKSQACCFVDARCRLRKNSEVGTRKGRKAWTTPCSKCSRPYHHNCLKDDKFLLNKVLEE